MRLLSTLPILIHSRGCRRVASVWRATRDDAPNESVFIFRSTTGEELIEGEWVPNQFIGILPERELVLNL